MSDPSSEIERINALTNNARNTWFALLAALVFVGVTLLSVKPIDFYGVGRATDLPLVGVSVPTNFFFYVAPILTVAIYGYFHLYLIRLWDALSVAPARINGQKLGSAIAPWLIVDSALYLRRFLRDDYCTDPRALDIPSVFWNIIFAWVAGPAVLIYLWIQSLPARDTVMSGIAAGMIIFSLIFFMGSGVMLIRRMRAAPENTSRDLLDVAIITGFIWVALSMIVATQTWHRTHPTGNNPAPLILTGEQITQRPDGWLPPELARAEARQAWCSRYGHTCSELSPELETAFEKNDWEIRRGRAVDDLKKPERLNPLRFDDLRMAQYTATGRSIWPDGTDEAARTRYSEALEVLTRRAPDFRDADLRDGFFAGANLIGARFTGAMADAADFERAKLDFADLSGRFAPSLFGGDSNFPDAVFTDVSLRFANLSWTYLREAQMQRADLRGAQMQGADLSSAQMQGAYLREAQMQGTVLSGAQMQGAVLSDAQLQGAALWSAQMQAAVLSGAQMQGANLYRAQMRGADLSSAQMQGAELSLSRLFGLKDGKLNLDKTNLSAAKNSAGALRFVDLRSAIWDHQTDFRNAFLDGSVQVTQDFRDQMGDPCQWIDHVLTDKEFFIIWVWWAASVDGLEFERMADLLAIPADPPSPALLDEHDLTDCTPQTGDFPTGK